MVLPSLIRQQSALLCRKVSAHKCLLAPKTQWRGVHYVPPLAHGQKFAKNGVGGMFSPDGFDIAWTQYQGYTVHRLNELTAGSPDEGSEVKDLLIRYARNADTASLFNLASMAHNNHFMFSTLTPKPQEPSKILSAKFLKALEMSFSSLDTLRETFIFTAASMFGPGFTWLVKDIPSGSFSILNTYLAGSPYPGAHWRKQGIDVNTTDFGVSPSSAHWNYSKSRMQAGSIGMHSSTAKVAPGGANLDTLMCVSTWEHAWLRDHGVAGKRDYLEEWWKCIDWSIVEARSDKGNALGNERKANV